MKWFLFLPLMLISAWCMAQVPDGNSFKLLPEPKKIEWLKGQAMPYKAVRFYRLKGTATPPLLHGILGALKKAGPGVTKGVLTLEITKLADLPSDEGYLLNIIGSNAHIRAGTTAGLFYGCQTFLQLLEDAQEQRINIPACKITDYPDIPYRAIHVDLKHHVDSLGYYYKMIDRLAQIKINAVIVEFEDKLKYRKIPAIGASHAISIDDFAALSRYAAQRHIEISPLVQGLGHASYILKHPEYKQLRDDTASDWAFDAYNPKTYDLQFALYEDAILATPGGKYLHIGGDEVGNLGKSQLSRQSGMKPFELQMYWLKKVCAFAAAQHRIPVFWDDMVFKLSGLYETTYDTSIKDDKVREIWERNEKQLNNNAHLFPENCIYMRWNYSSPDLLGNRKALDWYKSHNLQVMSATAGQTMWPMLGRGNSNFKPMKDFLKITAEKDLNGVLCTFWDDSSPHFETFWRSIYDAASLSWHFRDISANDAHASFRHRFYGPALSDEFFNFQDLLEQAFNFWDTALIEKGWRLTYPGSMNLIDLPDAGQPGAWTKKYTAKLARAKEEIKRYELIKKKIDKAITEAKRNDYSLRLFSGMNDLQVYSSVLLVKLEAYDISADKRIAYQQLKNHVNTFQELRNRFEKVFSETRMLEKPADYLQDQNHHEHLANGTLNSDWMYVYELALNRKILAAPILNK